MIHGFYWFQKDNFMNPFQIDKKIIEFDDIFIYELRGK